MDATKTTNPLRQNSLRMPSIPSFNDFNSFTQDDDMPVRQLDRAWSLNSDQGKKAPTPVRSLLERALYEHARSG